MERLMYMITTLIVLAYFLNRAGEQEAVVWMMGVVTLVIVYTIIMTYLDKKAKKRKDEEEKGKK